MGYDAWTGGRGFGFEGGRGSGRGRPDAEVRGPGGRGGRRRLFDSGELRLVLLKLIADSPRHGYDLIREMETLTGGVYAPSPGVVYPTLTLLDEMGLIGEQQAEGAKKQFAITEAGRAHIDDKKTEIDGLFERLAALEEVRARGDRAPIRRAMGNLHAVLHNRMHAGEITDETLHQVAAILDEAAQKIERL
jgi:DNA-binding PadR family transcriptional regulator